jgi:P27 family predicted phage terminase small subunit
MGSGGSGRRPLPSAMKKLRGNAGKRKLNDSEPVAPSGVPEMPQGLGKVAAKEWRSIVPELVQLGVLTKVDAKALAAYCHAFARWFQAERLVEKYGVIVEEPILHMGEESGFVRIKKNPACNVSEIAMKTMKSFLVEFGMTPAARSRIRIEKPKEADPFEDYLKKGTNSSAKHVN